MSVFGTGSTTVYPRKSVSGLTFSTNYTFSSWAKYSAGNTNAFPIHVSNGTSLAGVSQYAGVIYLNTGGGGVISIADAPTLNVWHHYCGVMRDSGAEIWKNGVLIKTGAPGTSIAPTLVDVNSTAAGYSTSTGNQVAEAAVWPGVALSSDEIKALAMGASPARVRPNRLLGYYPLRGDYHDPVTRIGLTPVGGYAPAYGDHPPVALLPRRRVLFSAATTSPATGTAAGSASVSGVGASLAAASGTSAGSATVAGSGAALAGSVGTVSDAGATVSGAGAALAGSVGASAGASTTTGAGAAVAASTGAADGTSTASGVSSGASTAIGTAAGSSTVSGAGGALAAAVAAAAGAGNALGVAAALSAAIGTATGTSTASGVAPGGAPAVGTAAGSSTVFGVGASTARAVGSAAGTSTITGVFGASATGTAAGAASVVGVGRSLVGATGTASGAASVVSVGRSLAGATGTVFAISRATGVALQIAPPSQAATTRHRTVAIPRDQRLVAVSLDLRIARGSMTDLEFLPKDPADDLNDYQIRFGTSLNAITSVTATLSQSAGAVPTGTWTTPGDTIPGSALSVSAPRISDDRKAVIFRAAGGVPGKKYAIRAVVQTSAGSLNRSAILPVTGL